MGKDFTTVKVERETMAKLREMAPGGNVCGYLTQLVTENKPLAEKIEELEMKINLINSVMQKEFETLARDLSAEFSDINARIDCLYLQQMNFTRYHFPDEFEILVDPEEYQNLQEKVEARTAAIMKESPKEVQEHCQKRFDAINKLRES